MIKEFVGFLWYLLISVFIFTVIVTLVESFLETFIDRKRERRIRRTTYDYLDKLQDEIEKTTKKK